MSMENPSNLPEESLGSLAQKARTNHLKSARGILIFVGVLTMIVNLAVLFFLDAMIQKEFPDASPEEIQAIKDVTYIIQGGFVLLGAVFVVLGLLVYRYPVVTTVLGLVLYVAGAVLSGFQGIVLKIIIIYFLFRAVQAAFAYQKERNESQSDTMPLSSFDTPSSFGTSGAD